MNKGELISDFDKWQVFPSDFQSSLNAQMWQKQSNFKNEYLGFTTKNRTKGKISQILIIKKHQNYPSIYLFIHPPLHPSIRLSISVPVYLYFGGTGINLGGQ